MSKSTGRSWGRKSPGTVTVIEARVHRSSERNARLGFFVTFFVVLLLTASVISDRIHPILALFVGAAAGIAAGVIVWALVRVWPVIRLLWWWTPEIGLSLTVVYGWTALARHTDTIVRLVLVVVLVGVPALLPWTRHRIVALAWCLIVRHRLRTCFAQFIISNQSGSLPLILWARPTPVGERVWVYLRPGLSLGHLEQRLDQIAVACHASTVIAERAADGNAAYLRFDVKRRDALKARIGSPLVDLVDPNTPATERKLSPVPTALDLPDVVTATTWTRPQQRAEKANGHPINGTKPTSTPAAASAASNGNGSAKEDVSDWI